MNENIDNIESVLNTDRLTECPAVKAFSGDFAEVATALKVAGGVYVGVHYRDDSAVVTVDYLSEMDGSDTAFAGDLEDAQAAVARLARHTDPIVVRDDFNVLDEAEQAGDRR